MNKSFPKTFLELQEWITVLEEPYTLSFDTETDGLKVGCELKGFSLCDGERACYVNLENNPEFKQILTCLEAAVENTELLIGHNIQHDLRVIQHYEIEYTGKIYDTMVAAHLLNENDSCGLKEVAKRRKYPESEIGIDWKTAVKNGCSSEVFKQYGIRDAIFTWLLWKETEPLIEKCGFHKLFYDIEMPFQFVLKALFIKGIKIDTEKLRDFDDILSAEKELVEIECVKAAGLSMIEETMLFGMKVISSPINLNSDHQVAKIIESLLKIKLPKTEPSKRFPEGQPSTAYEVLEPFKDKHPFVKALLKHRDIEKTLNTFVRPLYGKIDKDGRLRTHFNDCVARTGRLSSSNPNLQNIKKVFSKDDVVNIRELFVPRLGYRFVRADYDSQELRQLANVTGDESLIDAFNNDKDLHLKTANGCLELGLQEEELCKKHTNYDKIKKQFEKERHIGKNGINFPIIYGSTAKGIAYNNQVSEEIAQGWLDGFFKLYPRVKKGILKCQKELYQNHFVSNYFGRRRRFKEVDKKAIRQAFNFLIQGMCADLLRVTMIQMARNLSLHPEWDAHLVLTVHDDVIIEVKKECAEECKINMKVIMESSVNLDVPFLVDIKLCDSYAG